MHHSDWWGHFPEGRFSSTIEEEDDEPHHLNLLKKLSLHFPRKEEHT